MIFFVQKNSMGGLPPVIYLLTMLRDLGEKVVCFGFTQSSVDEKLLEKLGIEYELYPYRVVLFRDHPFYRLWQKATQWIRPYIFRRWFWRRFAKHVGKCEDCIIWTSEMETAAILGDRALSFGRRHVASLYELGDVLGRDYRGFDIRKFYKSATLIECEYNRAHILKAEEGIEKLPFVLPNKAYGVPFDRNMEISDRNVAEIVTSWKGKKVFLYQGALQNDRGGLFALLERLCRLFPDAIVAVMGRETEAVRSCRRRYANFSHVPFLEAPQHLQVTSHADIGVAFYEGGRAHGLSPLNPVYCAPNKIFEYAGFGMPIICNDIPGLRYTVAQSGTGICLEDISDDSVHSAADTLLTEYEAYSSRARRFFDSVDLVKIVKDVLHYARD